MAEQVAQLANSVRGVMLERLSEQLNEQTKADKDTTIFLQADKAVDYATLMTVMDTLRTAGYLKVGLVSMESVAP